MAIAGVAMFRPQRSDEEPLLNLDAPFAARTAQLPQAPRHARWVILVSLLVLACLAWPAQVRVTMESSRLSGLNQLGTSKRVIHIAYKPLGKCLDLERSEQNPDILHAVLTNCDFTRILSSQMWITDTNQGVVRNVLHNNKCLATNQFREFAHFGAETCKAFSRGHLWGLTKEGQLATLRGKKTGLPSAFCAVPQPGPVQEEEPFLVLQACLGAGSPTHQNQWTPVGTNFGRNLLAEQRKRPPKAIEAENQRREVAEQDGEQNTTGQFLTVKDLVNVIGLAGVHHQRLWMTLKNIFGALGPKWNRWQDILSFKEVFAEHSDGAAVMLSTVMVNILSNMAFAGMNFIQGSNGKDLIFLDRDCHLPLRLFTNQPLQCDATPLSRRAACTFQIPNYFESLKLLTLADFAKPWKNGPLFSSFQEFYTAREEPSWEDQHGQNEVLRMASEGLQAAKSAGVTPSLLAADVRPGFRFAFDLEGILGALQEGFYWQTFGQMKYAGGGAFGAAVVEEKAKGDVLGFLMMKSQLAMHLTDESGKLVADLTDLEQYKPLPGFAPLGGKATFEVTDGVLKTVQLQYNGHVYHKKDPDDDAKFQQSVLVGWNFAEKAIIASLLAKTQLLIHVGTIHMELAPTLQAVTIDALRGYKQHPLRQFLEIFTTRNIQATNNNLKIFFEFQGAEFGLAPLPVEEQLKLIADHMAKEPLNLAELDMQKFAEARGWLKHGFMPDWYKRAFEVQKLFDELIREFVQGAFEGDDANLPKDEGLVMWWKSMNEKMPALQKAAQGNWLNSDKTSRGIDYDVVAAKALAIGGNGSMPLPDLQPYVPPLPHHPPGYWTTTPSTTTTTTTTTFTGFYRPLSSLSQNPSGVLPQGSYAPLPATKFKNFYSSVKEFPPPASNENDNFFNLKSWLPPTRRLQTNQMLSEVAHGIGNMAMEMGALKDSTSKDLKVDDDIRHLAKQLGTLQKSAANVTQVGVNSSMEDLLQQMDRLQADAADGMDVAKLLGDAAKKVEILQERAKQSPDVTDTIKDVKKHLDEIQEKSGGHLDAVRDSMPILVSEMMNLKDKAASAINVTAGIDRLIGEITGLKDAAREEKTAGKNDFSSQLDGLQAASLTSNATENLDILTHEIQSVESLSQSVRSSTENLAREFDDFQERSQNAIEVAQGIKKSWKRLQTLKADASEALLVTDEINRLAVRLHGVEADANKSDEVTKGIEDLATELEEVQEKASKALRVADNIRTFAARVQGLQDQAHEVVDVQNALHQFASKMNAFQDQAASTASEATAGIKAVGSQLEKLGDSVEVAGDASKGAAKTVSTAVEGLSDRMDALEDAGKETMNVVGQITDLTKDVNTLKVKPKAITAVAGNLDHFAKKVGALQEIAKKSVEVQSGVQELSQQIKALQNGTAGSMGAMQGLKDVSEAVDAMKARTETTVKVANGVDVLAGLMDSLQARADGTVNVSEDMAKLTEQMDDLKAKTALRLNVSVTINQMTERINGLKNRSDAEVPGDIDQLASDLQQLKYAVEIAALDAVHGINEMAAQAKVIKEKVSISHLVVGPDNINNLATALKRVQERVLGKPTDVTRSLERLAKAVDGLHHNVSHAMDASESLKNLTKSMEQLQESAESANVTHSINSLATRLDTLQEGSVEVANAAAGFSKIENLTEKMEDLKDDAKNVEVGHDLSRLAKTLEHMDRHPPGVTSQALPNPAFQLGQPPAPVLPVVAPVTMAPAAVVAPAVALGMAGIAAPVPSSGREMVDEPTPEPKEAMSQEALQKELQQLPPLTVETLTRVLRTLFLWTSWVHEDVGHAWASFVYNPIHTPGFVPADGKGIPLPALMYRVAMFRNFVALERNKLTDPIADEMFGTTICNPTVGPYSWHSCQNEVNGVVFEAFLTFQRKLRELGQEQLFSEFAQHGFFSRVSDVESSASS